MDSAKVLIFAALAVASIASPVPQYLHSTGHVVSHSPVVSYSHAPLVSYSHAPVVSYAHAPVAVHAPVKVAVEHYAPAHYEFKYGVHDGHTHDIKEQSEKRDGDKVVGHYSLVEPDGTTRTVHYSADHHSGFNAVVTKSGHAVHPVAPVKVAVPVHKVVSAPIVSYAHAPVVAHAAPVLAHSYAPTYSHGSGVSYSNTVYH
ncbi:hypothetical protein C0J52_10427 [Blattella germanica]|nr:hypothetical protein C0J52_10427 [Blattella germanica]